MDGRGRPSKCRRNIAENYNRQGRVHERYRRQTTDGRATAYSEHEREFTFAKNVTPIHRCLISDVVLPPYAWSLYCHYCCFTDNRNLMFCTIHMLQILQKNWNSAWNMFIWFSGKIIKFVATRCHILRLNAPIQFQTPLGSLQRSPNPLAGFKGAYF